MTEKTKLGLLGKNISYSFSKAYFQKKFEELGLAHLKYQNYDIPEIEEFPFLLYHKEHEFIGMNVTIPYKESVIRFLDELSPEAEKIGAVNVIKITEDYKLKGYNTDIYGFKNALKPLVKSVHDKALILGTGGASKAIAYVLEELGISFGFVSRKASSNTLLYADLNTEVIEANKLIRNCTPLGTHPRVDEAPIINFEAIGKEHLLFDLVYNPPKSKFLREGEQRGATIKNGYEMLELQAEKAWEIWKIQE